MSFIRKVQKKIRLRTERRKNRVKNQQLQRGVKPRVSVCRSLNNIYAQIIDDNKHATLVSFSSINLKDKKSEKLDKKAVSKKVGQELGKLALSKSINNVFFDRGPYLYHGRVKALIDGLRESGVQV